MNKKFSIEIYDNMNDAKTEWLKFEENSEFSPFQSFQWLSIWHDTVGTIDKIKIQILFLKDSKGVTVAVLPLCIKKICGLRFLIFLGSYSNDYNAPLFSKTDLSESYMDLNWSYFMEDFPEVDVVHFDKIPRYIHEHDNPLLNIIGSRLMKYRMSAFSFMIDQTWPSFYQKKFNPKSRQTDRRKMRKIKELGEVTFKVFDEPYDVENCIHTLIDWKTEQYSSMNAPDIFKVDGIKEFYIRVAKEMLLTGKSNLSALYLNQKMIAAHVGLIHEKRFYYLIPAYNPLLSEYSPGKFLLQEIVKWCSDHGIQVFDLTIGNEPYKYQWADQEMELFEYLEGMTTKGKLLRAAIISLRKTKDYMKRILR